MTFMNLKFTPKLTPAIIIAIVLMLTVGGALFAGLRQTVVNRQEVEEQTVERSKATDGEAEDQENGGESTSSSVSVPSTTPVPTYKTVSISGFAYEDRNDNGIFDSDDPKIPYMQFYLYDSFNPSQQITTVYSDTSGSFSHTMEVRTGILVKPTASNNFVPKTASKTYESSNTNLQFGFRSASAPVPGQNVGIIEGDIFHDANRNLTRDSGENGVRFYKIYLIDSSGNYFNTVENAQTTEDSGHFKYENLPLGTYTISLSNPTGQFDILKPQTSITLTSTQAENKNLQIPVYAN